MSRRMAREASSDDEGLVKDKDFRKAARIYHADIAPNSTEAAKFMQEISTAYKAIKKECGVQAFVAKFVFKLLDFEEAKQEDAVRCLFGMMKELRIEQPHDLVDEAEAQTAAAPKAKSKPKLVTVPLIADPEAEKVATPDPDDF